MTDTPVFESVSESPPRSVTVKATPRAETITFGAIGEGGERLFGHYHAPSETHARATGVVLVSPLGFEDLCTYGTYRELAERLARAGFPTLRFDHHGTGDSAGDDADPARVRAWLDGIRTAIEELKARSGVTAISLFGLRMGALLAGAAASELGGVASLVAWAPLSAGRAYVREVRAYRMLNNKGATPSENGDEESAGFLLSSATVEALSKLDLAKLPGKIAEHALVLSRDENKSEERVAKQLEATGVATEFRYVPGYAGMMIEPRQSVMPEQVLETVVGWLDATHPARGRLSSTTSETASLLAESPLSKTKVQETALRLGEGKRLFGVLTRPPPVHAHPARARTALLLLTMAWHHRTGANRMHVSIAREAASLGFSAFRFDISGSGDSHPEPGVDPRKAPPRHFVPEVQSAMRHLRAEYGIQRFVLSGVCSGGSLGHMVAKADSSVAGAIIINPQRFYTSEDEEFIPDAVITFKATSSYKRALFQKETWLRAARGDVHFKVIFDLMRERAAGMARVRLDALRARFSGQRPKTESRVDLERMVDQGTDTLFIFSNDDPGIEYLNLHAGDSLQKLRTRKGFRIEMIDGADHTFTPLSAQKRLSDVITSHLVKTFG
jgi:alpha-beta hydrolase superfamily lysophospholipase